MREFDSPLAFAEHLIVLSVSINAIEDKGLEKCAKLIERDAKKEIGHLQPAVGPFQDWAELEDDTKDDKAKNGYYFNEEYNPLLRDGTLLNSIEHEVGRGDAVVGSKLDIAAYQEFGTKTIPPRPFIGPAAYKNKDNIKAIIGAAVVEGLTGGEKVHELLGYDMKI